MKTAAAIVLSAFLTRPVQGARTREADSASWPVLAGMSLRQDEGGVRVIEVLGGTPAGEMQLKSGDRLLYLNGAPVSSPGDAEEILRRWTPGTRLAAVVLREMDVLRLSSRPLRPEPVKNRGAENLTEREAVLRGRALQAAMRKKTSAPRGPGLRIDAGEKIWVRFPGGIPATVSQGQVLEGETSTAMTTDSNLDFLAIPQGSKVWAQVVSASPDEEDLVKLVRLHVFKIELKGGRTYGCSAIAIKVSGRQRLVQASPGGTLIAAIIEDEPLLASPDINFQIEFLYPWTLYEPAGYYRTGPGLWLKSGGDDRRRWFQAAQVIADRSADKAGIKAGDLIHKIDGVPAQRLSFLEAIRSLYGEAGSDLTLDVQHAGERLAKKRTLKRGAAFRQGTGIRARFAQGKIVAAGIHPGSPADKAGLKTGDILLRIGEMKLEELGRETLINMLADDMSGEDALVYRRPGENEKTADIRKDWYEVELSFKPSARRNAPPAATAPVPIKAPEPRPDVLRKPRGRWAPSPRKKP